MQDQAQQSKGSALTEQCEQSQKSSQVLSLKPECSPFHEHSTTREFGMRQLDGLQIMQTIGNAEVLVIARSSSRWLSKQRIACDALLRYITHETIAIYLYEYTRSLQTRQILVHLQGVLDERQYYAAHLCFWHSPSCSYWLSALKSKEFMKRKVPYVMLSCALNYLDKIIAAKLKMFCVKVIPNIENFYTSIIQVPDQYVWLFTKHCSDIYPEWRVSPCLLLANWLTTGIGADSA